MSNKYRYRQVDIGIGEDPPTGMANPSSEYCIQQGGESEIRTSPTGDWGVCKFKDGTECEEWAYKGGKCSPGQCKQIVRDSTSNKPVCGDPVSVEVKTDKSKYIAGGVAGIFLAILGIGLVSMK